MEKPPANNKSKYLYIVLIYYYLGGFMSRTLVDLQGPQELILQKSLELGLFKTKSEAVRGAINKLGSEYKMFKDAKELELELVARKMLQEGRELKAVKKKMLSEEEVKKKYGFK